MSTLPSDYLVSDVMISCDEFPVIVCKTIFKEALESMSKFRIGIACVVSDEDELLGIVTDGDIRRQLLVNQKPFSALFVDDAIEHAVENPVTVKAETSLSDAIRIMGEKQIWDLPVVDKQNKLVGLVHLHPAIKRVMGGSNE